ncbi:MAG: PepSY domain-containing protein [Bradyrhizobium sp.]
MTKPVLLKLHRWTTLVFALPLLAVIATGTILSFEPMTQFAGIRPQSLDAARVVGLIKRHDPEGKARGLSIDSAAQRLTLRGAAAIDLASGEAASSAPLAELFRWARVTHEKLLGQSWLVTASTIAMVVIMSIGMLMGLPRLRNTLSGWHKGAAWFTLPLILASPLTGLCMALGLTFQGGVAPAAGGRPVPLVEAVEIVAKTHDLATVVSIVPRGGRTMARIFDDGELRAYAVTPDGTSALPRNWPRLIHEGNWSATIGAALNVVTSAVLITLLTTGLLIWAQRQLRRRRTRRERDPAGRETSASAAAL